MAINPGTLDKFEERLYQFDRGLEFVGAAAPIGLGETLIEMVRDAKDDAARHDPFRFLDIRLSDDSLTGLAWVIENLPELIRYARAAYAKPEPRFCSFCHPGFGDNPGSCACGSGRTPLAGARTTSEPRKQPSTDWLGGVISGDSAPYRVT